MDNDEKMMQQIMEMLTEIKTNTKAILEETKDRRDKRLEAITNDDRNESTACQDVMEDSPEKMEPNLEEDVSEDVAVMPVKGLNKRRRGRQSTAGRRGEPKELIRGNGGSRRKLAAVCRKVSRHATVAWRKRKLSRKSETRGFCRSRKGVTVADRRTSRHATVAWLKRNLFRRSGTQQFCGQRKELTATGIRKIPCAQVVRRKRRSHEGQSFEQGTRNNWTRNKFERRTRKGRTLGRGQTMSQEGTNSSRNRGFKEQLRFGNVRKTRWVYRTTIGMNMVKQVVGTSSGLRRIRQWVLWMDRPPPKRKKEFHVEREPVM
jgi:hypothetical protein